MSNAFPSMISNEPPPLEQSDDEDEDSGDLRNFGNGLKLDVDPSPLSTPVRQTNVPAPDDSDKSVSNEDTDLDEPLPSDKSEGKANDPSAAKGEEDGISGDVDSVLKEPKGRLERPQTNFSPFPTTMKTSYIGSVDDKDAASNGDIVFSSGIMAPTTLDSEAIQLTNGYIPEDSFQQNKTSTESDHFSSDPIENELEGFKDLQAESQIRANSKPPAECNDFHIIQPRKNEPTETENEIPDFQVELPTRSSPSPIVDANELNDFKSEPPEENSADDDFKSFAGPVHVEVLQSASGDSDESCDEFVEALESKIEAKEPCNVEIVPSCDQDDRTVVEDSSVRFDDCKTQENEDEDQFGDFADFTGFTEPLPNSAHTLPNQLVASMGDTLANSTVDLERSNSFSLPVSIVETTQILPAPVGSNGSNVNTAISLSSSGFVSSFPDDDFGDDDFDEFQSAPSALNPVPAVVENAVVNSSSIMKDGTSNVIWTASRVEGVLKTLFTHEQLPEDVPGELRFRPIDKEIKEDDGEKEWRRVEDFEGSQGLLFKWLNSASYQKLLGSLRIDNSTIVYKSKWGIVEVPRFAASLVDSPLLPESSAKSCDPEPTVSITTDAPSEVLCRSDAIDVIANDSSSPQEDNVLPNFSNKPESPSIGNSMSQEAERILNQLPDLSYMRAKTLVFPTNNLHA